MDRKCIKCGRELIDKRNFLTHVAKCASNIKNPLKCSLCPLLFANEEMVLEHIRNKHKDNLVGPPLKPELYANVLRKTLKSVNEYHFISSYELTYHQYERAFENCSLEKNGYDEKSFIYLLIDPMIVLNLVEIEQFLSRLQVWERFLKAIFFVGAHTSTINSPEEEYSYLECPFMYYNKFKDKKVEGVINNETKRIIGLWKKNHCLICLHIFQCNSKVKVLSAQAAIGAVLNVQQLQNKCCGYYKGQLLFWPQHQKEQLGTILLYKAMLAYLNKKAVEIYPEDIADLEIDSNE